MKKIGLFFGSFNPVHVGHLILAESMFKHTELDEIWMVISPQNPFKAKKGLLDHHLRLKMVELATKGNKRIKASDVEFGLPKPSYTIDTLRHLKKTQPEKQFIVIIGEDNLKGLPNWKDSEELLREYVFYVYPRLGAEQVDWSLPNVNRVEAPIIGISSTQIRNRIENGDSIRYFVVNKVRKIIEEGEFYKKNPQH